MSGVCRVQSCRSKGVRVQVCRVPGMLGSLGGIEFQGC